MAKFIKPLFFIINIIIILGLLTIHFIVKDRSFGVSIYFYAYPLPVIITIILVLSIFLGKTRKYNIILAFLLLVVWLNRSFKINFADDVKNSDIEIVFWNASRDKDFEDVFIENAVIPDVVVLVEHGAYNVNKIKLKYPEYYFYKSDTGISIFSKSELKILKEISTKFKNNIIKFNTKGVTFYAIDIMGSTDVPRAWGFKYVDDIADDNENVILLGDFNVPYESLFLKKTKSNFNHAFNEKGNGFRETWPWNIPLLSLDHIWVSKDLKILKTEKMNTFQSDHAMIKTLIRI